MKGDSVLRDEVLHYFRDQAPLMGAIAVKHFGHLDDTQSRAKEGHHDDPVTIADTEISDLIVHAVKNDFGTCVHLLTEESAPTFQIPDVNSVLPIMVIDELDGSLNFKEGREHFSILLGLAENIDGAYTMTVGLIYKPLTNEFFYATIDTDAIHLSPDGQPTTIHISGTIDLVLNQTSVNVAIGRKTFPINYSGEYYRVTEAMEAFELANQSQVDANSKFSCGLEVMDIVKGEVDVYLIAKAANWDYAASSLILQQAGGKAYTAKSLEQLINPVPWTLQLDRPAAYYPAFFTNGHIDASLIQYMRELVPD